MPVFPFRVRKARFHGRADEQRGVVAASSHAFDDARSSGAVQADRRRRVSGRRRPRAS
jgi:hypothetical protein